MYFTFQRLLDTFFKPEVMTYTKQNQAQCEVLLCIPHTTQQYQMGRKNVNHSSSNIMITKKSYIINFDFW